MSDTLFMGTTKIAADKTAMQITQVLQRAKVQYVTNEYNDGAIVALRFCLMSGESELWYRLPVRWEPVMVAMRKRGMRNVDPDQAKRTAWRHVLRWLEAQLAMIEVGQSSAFEVFLPYMHTGNGNQTVGELFAEKHKMKLLPASP